MFFSFLFSFLSLISLSVQQKDPLKDFCRLFGHQTAVVDRGHYIDGGIANFAPISADSYNFSSMASPSSPRLMADMIVKALLSGSVTLMRTTKDFPNTHYSAKIKLYLLFKVGYFGQMPPTNSCTCMAVNMAMASLKTFPFGPTTSFTRLGTIQIPPQQA